MVEEEGVQSYFKRGDIVLFGKWKNKRGRVLSLGMDPETREPNIVVQPLKGGPPVTLRLFTLRRGPAVLEAVDLGRVAFGGERKGKDAPPFEEDTPSESNLLQSIVDYLDGTVQPSNDQVAAIKGWLASGEYSDIFVPPAEGTIYRSVSLPPEEVASITGIPLDRIIGGDGLAKMTQMGKETIHFVVQPRGGLITSWSTSLSAALHFGRTSRGRYGGEGDIIVVYEAATRDNDGGLLDLDAIYNKVDHPLMIDRFKEREVWGLGPIQCNRVRWYEAF